MNIPSEYRLGLLCFGIFLLSACLYSSYHFLKFARQYDAAASADGQRLAVSVLEKRTSKRSSGASFVYYYVSFEHQGKKHELGISEPEYNNLQVGDTLTVLFHPKYPNFFVSTTPQNKSATILLLYGAMGLLGLAICGWVLRSFVR